MSPTGRSLIAFRIRVYMIRIRVNDHRSIPRLTKILEFRIVPRKRGIIYGGY